MDYRAVLGGEWEKYNEGRRYKGSKGLLVGRFICNRAVPPVYYLGRASSRAAPIKRTQTPTTTVLHLPFPQSLPPLCPC